MPRPENQELKAQNLPLLDFFINPAKSGIVKLQASAMKKLVQDYLKEMSEETFLKVLLIKCFNYIIL